MRKRGLFVIVTVAAFAAGVMAQQAPDRSHPPEPGPAPALNMPPIQKRQLSNGLPVWIVELHDVPVAQINLLVLSGSANDPPGTLRRRRASQPRCSRRAPDRDRRSRSRTPSTSWARICRPAAASTRPPCACTCRWRAWPTR